jgi:hypothetical protein
MISSAGLVQEERCDVMQDAAVRDPLELFLFHDTGLFSRLFLIINIKGSKREEVRSY